MEPIKELNRGLWNLAAPGEINDDGVGRGRSEEERVRQTGVRRMTWTKLMNSKRVVLRLNPIFLEDL